MTSVNSNIAIKLVGVLTGVGWCNGRLANLFGPYDKI